MLCWWGSNGAHEFAELLAVVRVYLRNRFLKALPGRRSVVPNLSSAEDTSMSALGVLRSPSRTNPKIEYQSRGLF